jgi:tubulin--tyrosine ligase
MEENHYLANKKSLFYALREYYRWKGRCVFKDKVFPVTFHIKTGTNDPEYYKLVQCIRDLPKSVWIVKPGENSNRGVGI